MAIIRTLFKVPLGLPLHLPVVNLGHRLPRDVVSGCHLKPAKSESARVAASEQALETLYASPKKEAVAAEPGCHSLKLEMPNKSKGPPWDLRDKCMICSSLGDGRNMVKVKSFDQRALGTTAILRNRCWCRP